ncbi:MAG TPA: CDP-alcohol phosphatidyltransferase family protein [Syntrophorhabdus sp.]|nr:CDP-alcohol phosphatidyltransferase family protein [Syntrophorhabdus sp.]MBP8744724.1 CDP-alcohol phosphatidyltransferase family protein [Syntrophorhabdus sp.]HQG25086.1 CDP-alcohol phosphatidyltransferase family protein [Syntrophorhabdus sp.]HQH81598.1 CDP-alcohol phosphatidyltransferase family protein [Syntrophorhabdus sp.]HQI95387.1 CDP-alcohol phosphatidyltransferase family protein [Syntrophorhabdus sp.]
MISNKVGHSLDPAILKLYRFFFAGTTINPNFLTLIGAIFGYASAMCIAFGYVKTGGVVLLFSGFFDLLDGAIARSTNTVSRFGGFLDSVLDRYTDLFLMFGIFVFFLKQGQLYALVLTFVATIGVAIIPYARARAEAASIECRAGILERPERLVILLIGIFFNLLLYAVFVLAVLSHVTVIQRIFFVKKNS